MGSFEPLGTPDDLDTQESDTIILDGPPDTRGTKAVDPAPKPAERGEKKRKRGRVPSKQKVQYAQWGVIFAA